MQLHHASNAHTMHLTRIVLPLVANLSLAVLAVYAAIRFAFWTWVP